MTDVEKELLCLEKNCPRRTSNWWVIDKEIKVFAVSGDLYDSIF